MAGLDGGLNGRAVAAILKTGTLADLRGRPERRRKRQGPGAYRSADLPARVERCVDLEGLELLQVARCQASAQLPSQHRRIVGGTLKGHPRSCVGGHGLALTA